MIAKIGKGNNLFGALSYNLLKVEKENGQILFTQKITETLSGEYTTAQLTRCFEPYLVANNKTEKPILHISLNPDPKDQVSDEQFVSIAQDYMQHMGYGNQPFVVFKHTDTSRKHIHIVSTSVGIDGKKISDKFDHPRSMEISRALEKKYNLLPATAQRQSQDERVFKPIEYKKGDIKSQIASVVRHLPTHYRFQSLGEYNALLSLFNITTEEVKGELHGVDKHGLVYFALNKNGEKSSNPFKASLFGKSAGYKMLHDHFEKSKESRQKEPAKALLKNTIEIAMHTSTDEITFRKQLQEQGINTVVRRNDTGRVYGITFIEHNSKTVWNGSRLGKEFSANVFNDWWNNGIKPEIKTGSNKKTSLKPSITENIYLDQKMHNLFDFLGNNEPEFIHTLNEQGFIEGIGNLLPDAQGEDYEELNFENAMKKKKKRKL